MHILQLINIPPNYLAGNLENKVDIVLIPFRCYAVLSIRILAPLFLQIHQVIRCVDGCNHFQYNDALKDSNMIGLIIFRFPGQSASLLIMVTWNVKLGNQMERKPGFI